MPNPMIFHLELFGPRKGTTFKANGHQFIGGHYDMVLDPAVAGFALKVLANYGAYARGTPEYAAAQAREKEADGTSEVQSSDGSGAAEDVRSDVRQDGTEPTEEAPVVGSADASSEDGDTGIPAIGDGHSDSGVPKFEEAADQRQASEPRATVNEKLVVAIKVLDPANDAHWVNTGAHAGKPKLSAVEEAYGQAGLTRADIDAVAEGYTRELAGTDI